MMLRRVLRVSLLAALALSVLGSPSGAQLPSPYSTPGSPDDDLRLVFPRRNPVGGKVTVKLANSGERSYVYNPYYEACQMVFKERSGRKFKIPEGTHCDLVAEEPVAPGETVTLFKWDLDECIKDEWGCTKARDLPPGRYLMRGSFEPQGGGMEVRVTKRFRIVGP